MSTHENKALYMATLGCPKNGCWTCEQTPDGEPYCAAVDSCGLVKTQAANTGGGCSCAIEGGERGTGFGALMAGALFMLGLVVRRRRTARR